MAGDTAKAGFMPFHISWLYWYDLGVLNLLPIPVLDGGQLVMLGIEAVRGSPMPEKMENFFYMSGWIAVGFLMVFAFSYLQISVESLMKNIALYFPLYLFQHSI